MARPIPQVDITGASLSAGDVVRIVGIPNLSEMSSDSRAESEAVFSYLVGKYKTIREFDHLGLAWLEFTIKSGPHAGWHSVGIEPALVRRRRRMAGTIAPNSSLKRTDQSLRD